MKAPEHEFNMRRQSRRKESPAALYADFTRRLGKVETDHWSIDPSRFPPFPRKEPEFMYVLSLTRAVSPRARSDLHYEVRPTPPQKLGGDPSYDDFLAIDFPGKPELV